MVLEWKKIGDLGEVAKKLISSKKQTNLLTSNILTTIKVLENLRKLPELEGKGTISKKLSLITELLTSADSEEALYLVRTLIGDLRIGVQESTIKYSMLKAFFKPLFIFSKEYPVVLLLTKSASIVFKPTKSDLIACCSDISRIEPLPVSWIKPFIFIYLTIKSLI